MAEATEAADGVAAVRRIELINSLRTSLLKSAGRRRTAFSLVDECVTDLGVGVALDAKALTTEALRDAVKTSHHESYSEAIEALHPVNALVIFWLAVVTFRRAWRVVVRSAGAAP